MRKERLKGFAAGVLLMAMLSATLVFANSGVIRELHYGISIVFNGRAVQFDEESRPFVIDGRTFLPLRAMADLLGLPVDFDGVTNTAYVGYANTADLLIGRWAYFDYERDYYFWREDIKFYADGTGWLIEANAASEEEWPTDFFRWSAEGNVVTVTMRDFLWDFYFTVFRDVIGGGELLVIREITDGQAGSLEELLIRIND